MVLVQVKKLHNYLVKKGVQFNLNTTVEGFENGIYLIKGSKKGSTIFQEKWSSQTLGKPASKMLKV